jgi:3-hydroxyisobutyrate dehydrogenase-like beta-hydroxyacid dehydrogenase
MWDDLGPRWKKMLIARRPGQPHGPNLRKDLHTALALAQELNVNLYLGRQAALIADASVATGRERPLL